MQQNQLQLTISKKQEQLKSDITSKDVNEIYVLGSTQSGKTFIICLGVIEYCKALHQYNPNEQFNGAIVGWSINTIKGNIADVMEGFLNKMGYKKKVRGNGDYEISWGTSEEKYIKLWNVKLFFFSFNNVLAFNNILGKPLIFVWIDESARIYSRKNLQESFNQFPGRQISFAKHPYIKTIHSFNVEGSENHDYKRDYLDSKPNAKHYTFFPYDNPKLDTVEKMKAVVNMFPPGSLRQQKIFNKWCVAEGKVFNELNIIKDLKDIQIREIGIGEDYGSVNPTTFVPIALGYYSKLKRWVLIRLQCYFHDPKVMGDTPTTEFYSFQLRCFMLYLKEKYPHVPITTNVIDSEATHFCNRLDADNIPYTKAPKGAGSVDEGVQHLQSLIYKGYFYILECPSIKLFRKNGEYELSGKDDSKLEFESYQYDTIKAIKEGVNCYKKENDHSIDATRYLIAEWKDTGRCPVV